MCYNEKWRFDKNLIIPDKNKIYSINEGKQYEWNSKSVQIFVEILKRQNRSIRLAACFVTEVHRILQQGGIFLYPTDKKCRFIELFNASIFYFLSKAIFLFLFFNYSNKI